MKIRLPAILLIITLIGGTFMSMTSCAKESNVNKKENIEFIDTLSKATVANINENPNTFCNPINIGYQYQSEYKARESADPVVVNFKGEYYLFASHGSGFWHSTDLINWQFVYVSSEEYPGIHNFAPGVCVYNDELYINVSGSNTIYKTADPKSGEWEHVASHTGWLDPDLFVDDDGRVFNYFGGSPYAPLTVIELDPEDMYLLDGPYKTNYAYPSLHGADVPGDFNNSYTADCWMEGPWMTKHDGKYYLQVATPGTQYTTYANTVYVSDSPTGPFEYCDNSPMSFKSTGFSRGAGHGCTFIDDFGNYWKVDTVAISVAHAFERRLIMYPASFDQYGQMVSNLVFADYPMYKPSADFDFNNPGPDWNLLSYGKKAECSSRMEGHYQSFAFDENMQKWWSAETGNAGEWLSVDLGALYDVRALQLNFADQDCDPVGGRDNDFIYRYTIEFSQDGENWFTFIDKSDAEGEFYTDKDKSHDYYELDGFIGARYFKVTNMGPVPAGSKFAVSGLRIFGYGGGAAPELPKNFKAERNADDDRVANLTWDAVEDAEGYIIRYGNKQDSQYIHCQAININAATVSVLNTGVDYYFTIDSYNENGYTVGTEVVECGALKPKPKMMYDFQNFLDLRESKIDNDFPVYQADSGSFEGYTPTNDSRANGSMFLLPNEDASNEYFEISGVTGDDYNSGSIRFIYANDCAFAEVEIFLNGKSQGNFFFPPTGSAYHYRMVVFELDDYFNDGDDNTIKFVTKDQHIRPDCIQIY